MTGSKHGVYKIFKIKMQDNAGQCRTFWGLFAGHWHSKMQDFAGHFTRKNEKCRTMQDIFAIIIKDILELLLSDSVKVLLHCRKSHPEAQVCNNFSLMTEKTVSCKFYANRYHRVLSLSSNHSYYYARSHLISSWTLKVRTVFYLRNILISDQRDRAKLLFLTCQLGIPPYYICSATIKDSDGPISDKKTQN